jgi:hypothetical protein
LHPQFISSATHRQNVADVTRFESSHDTSDFSSPPNLKLYPQHLALFLSRFAAMEKRNRTRVPRRLTCDIAWSGRRSSGIVRDITDRGLFVQTLADPKPNSVVELIFAASGSQPEIRLEAGVARKRIAPPRLRASVPSGVGLEVLPPRTEYERWLSQPARPRLGESIVVASPYRAQGEQAVKAFRFRLIRRDRLASQSLTIRCETEAGARARALARIGTGWKIADVQPL